MANTFPRRWEKFWDGGTHTPSPKDLGLAGAASWEIVFANGWGGGVADAGVWVGLSRLWRYWFRSCVLLLEYNDGCVVLEGGRRFVTSVVGRRLLIMVGLHAKVAELMSNGARIANAVLVMACVVCGCCMFHPPQLCRKCSTVQVVQVQAGWLLCGLWPVVAVFGSRLLALGWKTRYRRGVRIVRLRYSTYILAVQLIKSGALTVRPLEKYQIKNLL